MIEVTKKITEYTKVKLDYYIGSLDFPCDFCNSNSYRNYHYSEKGEVMGVFCESCLKKCKSEAEIELEDKNR